MKEMVFSYYFFREWMLSLLFHLTILCFARSQVICGRFFIPNHINLPTERLAFLTAMASDLNLIYVDNYNLLSNNSLSFEMNILQENPISAQALLEIANSKISQYLLDLFAEHSFTLHLTHLRVCPNIDEDLTKRRLQSGFRILIFFSLLFSPSV